MRACVGLRVQRVRLKACKNKYYDGDGGGESEKKLKSHGGVVPSRRYVYIYTTYIYGDE